MFALPLAQDDSEIWVKGTLESTPYVDLTLEAVKEFGVKVQMSDDYNRFRIPGGQQYKGLKGYGVEGDYSSAAFLLAAGAIGGSMEVHGLKKDSKQGDSIILRVLKSMGADVRIGKESVKVVRENLYGIELDARNIPDLVPILAVLGCYAKGKTRIFNAGRLRMKESDRLASITSELRKMGAEIEEKQDELIISGSKLTGAVVDAHRDHRIAMSCAIAALGAKGKTAIEGAEAIGKSYPDFFSDLAKITQKKK
ncbi:3-phosphoshikimate 1-carboxyvinyltransferase [Candidatus Gugararchaeum adminiculabundum]|nr:3-phosphoshikimate 1-carboxyvinyltransferase [Candidatus Gugararchaeum adminiculabundum]